MFSKSTAFYDALYSFKDYAAEAARLRALIQERTHAATLLDVACGTGKHLELLRQWYAVEGLDLDPDLLEIARHRLPDVPLNHGDMTDFDLGRQFDAVVCLFSSIGYAGTANLLRRALACMARHVAPGGALVVEPWFTPEAWHRGRPHALLVDQPDLKICRMNVSNAIDGPDGPISVLDFHYLVATPIGVEHFTEHHELALFTDAQYRAAFAAAGLRVEHDPDGLIDRGLYIARHDPPPRPK